MSVVSSCSVLAGNQYRNRHDKTGKKTSSYARNLRLNVKVNGSQPEPEPVPENEKCKIFQDFAIQTDKEIEHRRRDIAIIDKEKREYKINDIAVPRNRKNYQYLDLRL